MDDVMRKYPYMFHHHDTNRSSYCSAKKDVLKNIANFIGKYLCWSSFNKVTGLLASSFI